MKTQRVILRWLKANGLPLGGLTSHDTEALMASVALVPLISWSGAPGPLFDAYRNIVCEMQPSQRHLAYHAIAAELDWGHRDMIWVNSGLADLSENKITTRAAAAPEARP